VTVLERALQLGHAYTYTAATHARVVHCWDRPTTQDSQSLAVLLIKHVRVSF